ncbi:hypothetical protein LR48_Vigan10g129500 [Vigna angularis]|uniref:Uncharacterized protein n=1 Tax=Phaseolus angularis TaxID=3914 RepID=A0A0L9VK82_PHAAN|nr:hypothetical protein LR48_Vigan10g129500 [Vigna angularis]
MIEGPYSSGDEVSTSRPTRGATRSYLGVLALDRISILTPSFDHVSEADQNLIWQDLLIEKEGSPTLKKIHLSKDNPLGALHQLSNIIADAPMIVPWDSTTFRRDSEIPFYLHKQDVEELASGRKEIDIILVQLWIMYMFGVANNMGFNDVYEFIDPHMTHEGNKFDDIQAYITSCFAMGNELYFIPYILGSITTLATMENDLSEVLKQTNRLSICNGSSELSKVAKVDQRLTECKRWLKN